MKLVPYYLDEEGDAIEYRWYKNPIKWFIVKKAWRRLEKRVKIGGPIEFTGVNKVTVLDYEDKK